MDTTLYIKTSSTKKVLDNKEIIEKIKEIVKENPNNYSLGEVIRKFIKENIGKYEKTDSTH